jgi:transposase-like protein
MNSLAIFMNKQRPKHLSHGDNSSRSKGSFHCPHGWRASANLVNSAPDPEVPEKKPRRKFTAQYKLRILAQADACSQPGQMGALLHREGLYSSNLATWRQQREKGILQAMTPKRPGRKRKQPNPLAKRVAQLEKENRRLQQKLKKADLIIEAQKKMSEILGIAQNLDQSDESI